LVPRIVRVVLLIAALAAAVLSCRAIRPDPARRNFDILPDMAVSPAYAPQSANPDFPDGKTLQHPPEGAILRRYKRLHYSATPADAIRAEREPVNPYTPDDAPAIARGAVVYANFCAACHGADASGQTPVTQRGFPPPPSLLAENARAMKDGRIFRIITYGQNNMPPYAALIWPDDRWKAVAYVRSMQTGSAPAPTTMPTTSPVVKGEP